MSGRPDRARTAPAGTWTVRPSSIARLALYHGRLYATPVIKGFHGRGTADVFNHVDSKRARKACPESLWSVARRKLNAVSAADRLEDLKVPPGNVLEALKGDRAAQHSIRINDQYRVCFRWTGTDAEDIEIADYH